MIFRLAIQRSILNFYISSFHNKKRSKSRSTRSQMFFKIGVLRNFVIFTGKQSSLFNNVACLRACNFLKKRLHRRCFAVKIAKSLRTPFLQNNSGSSLGVGQNWYQIRNKTRYIPKVSNFSVEKWYIC